MPFHDEVEWTSVGVNMAMSFAFWYMMGYVLGGDKWSPALIGMSITGVRQAVAGKSAAGALPDRLGVVTAGETWTSMPSYSRGGGTGKGAVTAGTSAVVSAGVTFVFWLLAGYFVIRGSAWKYASTAAVIAAIGSFVAKY